MATKTARFELVNPYQKYGLKRKPTFNEILGLLSEDQKLLRPFQTEQQHNLEIHHRVVSLMEATTLNC